MSKQYLQQSKAKELEERGYIGVPNRKIIREIMETVRKRKHRTCIKKSEADNLTESDRALKARV